MIAFPKLSPLRWRAPARLLEGTTAHCRDGSHSKTEAFHRFTASGQKYILTQASPLSPLSILSQVGNYILNQASLEEKVSSEKHIFWMLIVLQLVTIRINSKSTKVLHLKQYQTLFPKCCSQKLKISKTFETGYKMFF